MYSPTTSAAAGSEARGSFVQSSPDYMGGPPRKKMRKGTKSCLECRRRKIKCTFEPNRQTICNECYARGSTCIDQEHGDVHPPAPGAPSNAEQSYSLRERVTQLEGLVREVLNRLPEQPGTAASPTSTSHTTPAQSSAPMPAKGGRRDGGGQGGQENRTGVQQQK